MMDEASRHTVSTQKVSIRRTFQDKSKKNYTTETSENVGYDEGCSVSTGRGESRWKNKECEDFEDADILGETGESGGDGCQVLPEKENFRNSQATGQGPKLKPEDKADSSDMKRDDRKSKRSETESGRGRTDSQEHSKERRISESGFNIENLKSYRPGGEADEILERIEVSENDRRHWAEPPQKKNKAKNRAEIKRTVKNPRKVKNFSQAQKKRGSRRPFPASRKFQTITYKKLQKNCSKFVVKSKRFQSRANSSSLGKANPPSKAPFNRTSNVFERTNLAMAKTKKPLNQQPRKMILAAEFKRPQKAPAKSRFLSSRQTKKLNKFIPKRRGLVSGKGPFGRGQSSDMDALRESLTRPFQKLKSSMEKKIQERMSNYEKKVLLFKRPIKDKLKTSQLQRTQKRNQSLNWKTDLTGIQSKRSTFNRKKISFKGKKKPKRKTFCGNSQFDSISADKKKEFSKFQKWRVGRSPNFAKGRDLGEIEFRFKKFGADRGGSPLARKLLKKLNGLKSTRQGNPADAD